MKKRIIFASTVSLSFAPVLATQAEEVLWTARSVEQIQNDLTKMDNKTSYTVQYGDTLSTIAEALGVDVTVLANLNKITNMDLIFPETVLTTTVNEAEEVTEVETVASLSADDILLDIRSVDEQDDRPLALPGVEIKSLPFYKLSTQFGNLDQGKTYLLYCERGVMSRLQALYLREQGFMNVKVYRP